MRWSAAVGSVAAAIAAVTLSSCASAPAAPTAAFLGDSYTAGAALDPRDLNDRWATLVAAEQGWTEVNAGCTGSGYTRVTDTCPTTYRERLGRLVDAHPDIVVISGGTDDLAASDKEVTAAVKATFLAARETFPAAKIYAIGGISPDSSANPALSSLNTAVAEAAESVGAVYVDIGEPLQGRPDLVAADGVHPNSEGHAVIAELTSNVIGQD